MPLFTVMLAVFTAFPMFASLQGDLERYFLHSLVPDNIARPVLRALTEFAGKARGMGTVGLVLLVVTALALMLTIDRTLNAIWRVRQTRPLAQRVLVYWAGAHAGAAGAGPEPVADLVCAVGVARPGRGDARQRGLRCSMRCSSSCSPRAWRRCSTTCPTSRCAGATPGPAASSWRVAFEAAQRALVWYVTSVPSFSAVYGAFATVPILLLWIYLGWVIVLLGAVIAAYAPSLQMRVASIAPTAGWRFELALTLLARSWMRRGMPAGTACRWRPWPSRCAPIRCNWSR